MWALRQQLWQWRGVLITVPSVAGLLILLRFAGLLQSLELWALDQAFRLRPLEPRDPRIVIVGINDADLAKVGEWHVPDGTIAQLLEKLNAQQPRAIGLDLARYPPLEPGHQALVKVFESTPNLVGVEKTVGDRNNPPIAPNPVLSQLGQVSSVDVVPDADSKLRRGMLFLTPETSEAIDSLGLRLALMYLEAEGITPEPAAANPQWMQLGQAVFTPFEANDGGYIRADAGGYQIIVNFRGPAQSFYTVSMSDVLENRIPSDLVRDRIVLIGATAARLRDSFNTPYSGGLIAAPRPTPGVEIQANLTSQILSAALDGRPLIQVWPDSLEWLWIILCSGVGATLSWTLRLPRWIIPSIFFATAGLLGSCYLAFLGGWWIPVVPPTLALIGSAAVITSYIANLERQDRQTVMNLFGRHVTPEIAEAIWRDRHQLLQQGRLLGQKMTATVLFTDLQDFSSRAERSDPEVLMSWLNEYMEAMAQTVLDHGGVVDKFIGDSVMAVFGVPIPRTSSEAISIDACQAVRCALAMAATLETLNQKWQAQGHLTTAMRVGIATGTVIAGSLGSSQRVDYTTIGDSVNVASRLESYNKAIAKTSICRILISEETYLYTQNQFLTQKVGSVLLKGRQQPTVIYQVLLE